MEEILLSELRLLAEMLGPQSQAAKALAVAAEFDRPRIRREGRWLCVVEGGSDAAAETLVMRRLPGTPAHPLKPPSPLSGEAVS